MEIHWITSIFSMLTIDLFWNLQLLLLPLKRIFEWSIWAAKRTRMYCNGSRNAFATAVSNARVIVSKWPANPAKQTKELKLICVEWAKMS